MMNGVVSLFVSMCKSHTGESMGQLVFYGISYSEPVCVS